jgi:hypothetical protein
VIRNLTASEVLVPEFGTALREVISICNRAIHGEDIRDIDAKKIADAGIDLLGALEKSVRDYATNHPTETSLITLRELDECRRAKYRLTTIVPLSEKPERRVYILRQNELDDFFDGYSEYAEFIVELERIE